MKKVNDNIVQKLLEICKYIKWKNVSSEKEYYNQKKGEQK